MHVVDRGDLGDDVHRHLVVVARGRRDVEAAEGVLASRAAPARAGRRARRCPPRSSARGGRRPCPATRCPARARRRPAGGGRLRRTRRCPSAAHYRPPGRSPFRAACRDLPPRWEGSGEVPIATWRHVHPPRPRQRVALIDQMAAEWQSIGRSRSAVRALRGGGPARSGPGGPRPRRRTTHRRRAPPPATSSTTCGGPRGAHSARRRLAWSGSCSGRPTSIPSSAGCWCRSWSRASSCVAGKLQWGRGGEWQDGEEFFGELLSTAWLVLQEWSGQDRPTPPSTFSPPSAAGFGASSSGPRRSAGGQSRWAPADRPTAVARTETDLEELARMLIDLHREGMRSDEVQVLYAHHVLGYSMAELAALTGRDRRALYARRDRGQRRLCA